MSSFCLVNKPHLMINRRLVIIEDGRVDCYKATAYLHSLQWKHGKKCNAAMRFVIAVRWLVCGV